MSVQEAEILQRVRTVLVKHHEPAVPDLTATTTLDELGLDSFDAINLTFALEEEFGVEIAGEGLRNMKNLGDVVTLLGEALNKEAAS